MLILVTIIGSCRNQRFSDTEKIVKEWIWKRNNFAFKYTGN